MSAVRPEDLKNVPFDSEPPIDFVLVHDKHDITYSKTRKLFENAMMKTGLIIIKENIGSETYILITAPFERLAFEAEQVKLEMDLKGCAIEKTDTSLFFHLRSYFETDDELDFVSGPFETEKLHLFEGHENQNIFFRSALRSLLVHHILINLDYSADQSSENRSLHTLSTASYCPQPDSRRRGLPYLLVKNVYKDAFILHDQSADDPSNIKIKQRFPMDYANIVQLNNLQTDPRKELNQKWKKFCKFQPLWKIRNYFGEKIAFYFAWEGVYISLLWAPAILGLCVFFYGFYKSRQSSTYMSCECKCGDNSSNISAFEYKCEEVSRDNAIATFYDTIEEIFNNEANPWFAFFICLWGTFFMEIWKRKNCTLSYEWDVNGFESSEPDRPEFFGIKTRLDPVTKEVLWIYPFTSRLKRQLLSILAIIGMLLIVVLTISSVILMQVAARVHWNCMDAVSKPNCIMFCQQDDNKGDPTTCFMMTAIFPAMINALLVVFWEQVYNKIAVRLTNMENHQTQTDHDDSLVMKLFVFQFVNSYAYLAYIAVVRPDVHRLEDDGLFGLGEDYKDTCNSSRCMSYLTVQIFLLMVTKPLMKVAYDVIRPRIMKNATWFHAEIQIRLFKKEKELFRRKSSIFSHEAFTLKFLQRERNKPPLGDFALEAFSEKVIQFGYVVMFTVAFPLAPVIALFVSLLDLRFDAHRLLWFNRRPVAHLASDIGTWQPILQFINFCGVLSNGFLVATASGATKQYDTITKLFIIIAFEHTLFFLMYICQVVIPDVPARIKEATRREKYQVNKILADGYIPTVNPISTRSSSPVTRVSSVGSVMNVKQIQLQNVQPLENALFNEDHHQETPQISSKSSSKIVGLS